jgi:hypothetical protein
MVACKYRMCSELSLEELNAAIAGLLDILNNRPFKKMKGTRSGWFETIDRPAMRPLPATR